MRGTLLPWLAAGAVFAALYPTLLARLRRREQRRPTATLPWWFRYARDLTNLVSGSGWCLVFWLAGWPLALALLWAALATLGAYLMDWLLSEWLALRHSAYWVAGFTFALGSLPLVFAAYAHALATDVIHALFDHANARRARF